MSTKLNPVDQAETILTNLVAKRSAALDRQDAVAEEMRSRGFAAHAEGDAPSQKRLRELSAESALLDGEIVGLDGAISEGQARLAQARREAEHRRMLERVAEARKLLPELREAGAACSRSLRDFLLAFGELKAISTEIRRSGVGRWPSGDLFDVLARNSLQKVLRPQGLSEGVLPAGNIRELQSLIEKVAGEYELSLRRALDPDAVDAEPVDESEAA